MLETIARFYQDRHRQAANWYFNRNDATKIVIGAAIGWSAASLAGDIVGENVSDLDTIIDLLSAAIATTAGARLLKNQTGYNDIKTVIEVLAVAAASLGIGHELSTYSGDWPILAQARDAFTYYRNFSDWFFKGPVDPRFLSLASGLVLQLGYYFVQSFKGTDKVTKSF